MSKKVDNRIINKNIIENYRTYLKDKFDGKYDNMEIKVVSLSKTDKNGEMTFYDISWYIVFYNTCGDNNEFIDGEFIIQLDIPASYPNNPPSLKFLTPTGIFDINKNVCLSIGSFHAGSFPSTFGILGYVNLVYGAMIGWKDLNGGISIINNININEIKKFSKNSKLYNQINNQHIMEYFNNYNETNNLIKDLSKFSDIKLLTKHLTIELLIEFKMEDYINLCIEDKKNNKINSELSNLIINETQSEINIEDKKSKKKIPSFMQ